MDYDIEISETKTKTGMPVYLCSPTSGGPYPSVVLLHERYGFVDMTANLARAVAAAGYAVAAPDLYYQHPDQAALHVAAAHMDPMSDGEILSQLDDAVTVLPELARSDPSRLAMIGFCATGRHPLVYGSHRPLQACVVIHGLGHRNWEADALHPEAVETMLGRLEARFLGMFGEKDAGHSIDDVLLLRNALEKAKKSYEMYVYVDAPHGWMNYTIPSRYRANVTAVSWGHLLEFLDATLSSSRPDQGLISWKFNCVQHDDYDFTKNVMFS